MERIWASGEQASYLDSKRAARTRILELKRKSEHRSRLPNVTAPVVNPVPAAIVPESLPPPPPRAAQPLPLPIPAVANPPSWPPVSIAPIPPVIPPLVNPATPPVVNPATPPLFPNPDFTLPIHDNTSYQNLPSLQYLMGLLSQSDYNRNPTSTANGPFETQLPLSGGINMRRAWEIAQDQNSQDALRSLYRGGNMNYDSILAQAARRAPVGQAISSTGIFT